MSDRTDHRVGRKRGALLRRLGRGVLFVVLFGAALAVLGTLVPAIPYLLFIAYLTAPFGIWIILGAAVALGLSLRRWRHTGRRGALVTAALALFVLIGGMSIAAGHVATAKQNGLSIDLVRTLWPGPVRHRSLAAQASIYAYYGREPLSIAVYRPARDGASTAPILVYVHGGGWISGVNTMRDPDMRWYADRGFLVFAVEYTLSNRQRHLWDVTQPQIACALAWIGRNAERLGGDPRRIVTWGESAGGNLVLTVPYMANAGRLGSGCGPIPRIAATVSLYPVIDVAGFHDNDDIAVGGFARQMASQYTGGSPRQFPERYAYVSPMRYIGRAAPPTLLIVGRNDHLVAPQPATAFAARAAAAGIDLQLISLPNAEHAFDMMMSGSLPDQIVRQATMKFLAARGLTPATAAQSVAGR